MQQYNVTVSMGGSAFPTRLTYNSHSTSTTLTAGESGTVVGNDGAVGAVIFDLPVASTGLNYNIIDTAQQDITVRPPAGVTVLFNGLAKTNAAPLVSQSSGAWLHIVNISATVWVVYASSTSWA